VIVLGEDQSKFHDFDFSSYDKSHYFVLDD
jgi:hypothetical protein